MSGIPPCLAGGRSTRLISRTAAEKSLLVLRPTEKERSKSSLGRSGFKTEKQKQIRREKDRQTETCHTWFLREKVIGIVPILCVLGLYFSGHENDPYGRNKADNSVN